MANLLCSHPSPDYFGESDSAYCWDCMSWVDPKPQPETEIDEWEDLESWLANRYFGSSLPKYRSCEHAQEPVKLSDGTVVYASSFYDRKWRDLDTDLAIYLDPAWPISETGETVFIQWPDYSVPAISDRSVIRLARDAYETATDGGIVEVACLGSHGRTGTFLALLDLLAQGKRPRAQRAISQVRKSHCHKCVETKDQERFVARIGSVLRRERRHR